MQRRHGAAHPLRGRRLPANGDATSIPIHPHRLHAYDMGAATGGAAHNHRDSAGAAADGAVSTLNNGTGAITGGAALVPNLQPS